MAQAPAGPAVDMPDMGQLFLDDMDINKDGKVTLAEFRKPSDDQFAFMDTNKDGSVTADEARAFARVMMQRMQQMQQNQRRTQQLQMPR
jgi:Ca2+-binding EF-hand superfamily protein